MSRTASDCNHSTVCLPAGYLLPQWSATPGRWQVHWRYERLDVEDKPNTSFASAGVSWLLDGHARKVTLDWTRIDHDGPSGVGPGTEDRNLVTLQVAAGL